MIEKITYIAEDGKEFDDKQDCVEYERKQDKMLEILNKIMPSCGFRATDEEIIEVLYQLLNHCNLIEG